MIKSRRLAIISLESQFLFSARLITVLLSHVIVYTLWQRLMGLKDLKLTRFLAGENNFELGRHANYE